MKVRVIKPFGWSGFHHGMGEIMDPWSTATAKVWIGRGWVELVVEPVSEIKVEVPPKRKRGRPRKHPVPL